MLGAELDSWLVAGARNGSSVGVVSPAAASREPGAQVAAQVAALAGMLSPDEEGLWVTISPPANPNLPGELLRQLRAAGFAIHGFADRSALLAAWLQLPGQLVVIDPSRLQLSVGVAGCEDGTAALRRSLALPGGMQGLIDAWLELAAATFVQQTRFDPLHDQRHESALREQLPAVAAAAQRDGQGTCSIGTDRGELVLSLTRDQLAGAAASWLQPVAGALQALSAATDEAALLLPESLLDIPGFDTVLSGARFARLYRTAEGVAAMAASLLPAAPLITGGGVPYRTRLPVLDAVAENVLLPLNLQGDAPAVMATHVVYRGRVLPITGEGLVIGREAAGAAALRLPEGIAGLSRRHCTLRRDGARAQLIDHSSHGTWLDGVRVRGRALLAAGSTLRLGDPGIELALVALDASGGG